MAIIGDAVVLRGPVAAMLAVALESVPGGISGFALRRGVGVNGETALRSAVAALEEAGARWTEAKSGASRTRSGETGGVAEPASSEAWISPAAAAQILGISTRRVQQLAASRDLEAWRVGSRLLIRRESALKRRDAS